MKRLLAPIDVVAVLALFLGGRLLLEGMNFGDWQRPIFGAALVSSSLLFLALPLIFVFARGREAGSVGLTTSDLGYHSRVAVRAAMFVAPATVLFPVVALLGSTPTEWLGASILTVGFLLGGLLFVLNSHGMATLSSKRLSWSGLLAYFALIIVGLTASLLLLPISHLATRLVAVLIFVAFLEEFFFRGYVQSRLNDCFGKPFTFLNVEFGAGMFLAAALFGLFHPISAADGTPWLWGLWTAALGLVLGFMREKTGAIAAPAMLHGIILIPSVLFAPAAVT